MPGGGGGDNGAAEALSQAQADADAQKKLQQDAEAEDQAAIARGLRGQRSLLSSAGQLGFPSGLGAGSS